MTPGLAAVVVNYQGAARIAACLDALRPDLPEGTSVTLVDDASTDHGVELVRARFPDVRVCQAASTGGPAIARNLGFAASRAPRILFVDNDVVVRPGCVARLTRALDDDPEATFALPRIVRARAPGVIDFEGADSHLLGQLVPRHAGESVPDVSGPVSESGSLISSCFLVDRERWGDRPLFDPSFRFNYEDHELGLRSRLLGHRILVVPEAVAQHGTGTVDASVRDDEDYPALRVQSLIAGRWRILLTLYRVRTLVVLTPALVAFEAVQLLGVVRRGWLPAWWRALRRTLLAGPALVRTRRTIQRLRRVPDRDLLVGGALPFRSALPRSGVERAVLASLDRVTGLYLSVAARLL